MTTTIVVYDGPYVSVDLADGTACPKGKPVEVASSLAKHLLKQDFITKESK